MAEATHRTCGQRTSGPAVTSCISRAHAAETRFVPSSVTPGRLSSAHFAQVAAGAARNGRPASVTLLTLVELDLLQRRHPAQDLQAAIGDLRQTRVVVLQMAGSRCVRSRRRSCRGNTCTSAVRAARSARRAGSRRRAHRSASARAATGSRGKRRQRRVVHDCLQLTPSPRSAGIFDKRDEPPAAEVRDIRVPRNTRSVRDRLSASNPSSVATVPCARSRRRRGIAAKCRIASLSLSRRPRRATRDSAGCARCAKPCRA